MNTIKWTTYNKLVIIIFFGYLFIVGYKVYLADPYWLWTNKPGWHDEFKGGNRVLDKKQRFTKLLQVVVQQPDIVILGSSRIYRGVDTETLNKMYPKKIYNMGISSLKITEMEAFVKHIVKWTKTKKIIIGLEFHTFRGDILTLPGFEYNTGSLSVVIDSFFAAIFSKMAFKDAKSVYKNSEQWKDGKWNFSGYKDTIDRESHVIEKIFKDSERSYKGITVPDEHYKKLVKIIELATNEDVEITFLLTPMTKRQLSALKKSGALNQFKEWQKRIKHQLYKQEVIYFDLINDHPFVKEDLSNGSSREWIDYHHFKPVVGSWILSKFFISL